MEMERGVVLPAKRESISQSLTLWPANDFNLTEKDLEKAVKELNETEEIKKSCLRELKSKLSDDEKVKYRTDDEYLLRFLRIGKFSIEKAYKKIQDFYSVRKKYSEVFDLPPNLESLLKTEFCTRLPYLDQEGRIIMTFNIEKWIPAEMSFFEMLTLLIVISDITTMNPKSQINGIVGIWDMKGLSASHFAQFVYPGRMVMFFKILQGCYPWRLKAIIGINCGKLAETFYKLIKPFLKTKMTQRMFLLGSNLEDLHQHVNPSVLPKHFGGKLEDNECSITQHVLDNIPYLKYERSFGVKVNNDKRC